MNTTRELWRFVRRRGCLTIVGVMLAVWPDAMRADIHLDMLKTRTDKFTDVTVYNRSKTDIFIRHSQGIASVKFTDLDPETLALLNPSGLSVKTAAAPKSPAEAGTSKSLFAASEEDAPGSASKVKALEAQLGDQITPSLAKLEALVSAPQNRNFLWTVGFALLLVYLFVCFCLKLICEKAGEPPGLLVWLPVLQLFPLLRAARMSGWWFVAWFIPVINLIAPIIWCFKIVDARGKNALVAICLLLPVTNLLALLYLAFSSGAGSALEVGRKVMVSGPPVLAEA
jgi:hypothetical protein